MEAIYQESEVLRRNGISEDAILTRVDATRSCHKLLRRFGELRYHPKQAAAIM